MKCLFVRPHDMTCESMVGGLISLDQHEVEQHVLTRHGLPVDQPMLNAVDQFRPDVILYIGTNDPMFAASASTWRRMRKLAPTVLLCFDGSDATWIPVLESYRHNECFDLVVNIDGNDEWPKGPKDYTTLTPTDPTYYQDQLPILERPIKFGFAGGYSSPSRRAIVEYLIEHAGLVVPKRNELYGSYKDYAKFMTQCQIVLNVPMSGSEQMQVKGRVIEAGMAGCCLLEMEGAATEKWFVRARDFFPYKSREAAAFHVDVLQREGLSYLAENLQHRVRAYFAPSVFWPTLFERLHS